MKNRLETIYTQHIRQEKIVMSADMVDFIGVNFDVLSNKYGIKTYYSPISGLGYKPSKRNVIVDYTTKKNMNRFFWKVRDKNNIREYLALMNRNDENIECLFNNLIKNYGHVKDSISEIKSMSEMKITDQINSRYSSVYILGFKGESDKQDVINFEWITRRCPDPNDVGFEYKYDDKYFLDFLMSQNINEYNKICHRLYKLIQQYAYDDLHLWMFASDYFPDGGKKYKIYLKGNMCNVLSYKMIFENLNINIDSVYLGELDTFKINHNEMRLYGFALCLDTNDRWSLNSYYKII